MLKEILIDAVTFLIMLIPLGKECLQLFLALATDKQKSRLCSLILLRQPTKDKERSKFIPVVFHFKTNIVSHMLVVKGLNKYLFIFFETDNIKFGNE